MKQFSIVLVAIVACGIAGWNVYRQAGSAAVEVTVGDESDEITLINTATGEVSRGEWIPTPAVDPRTGERTLAQALYCAKCAKWYPAPASEMAERFPGGPICYRDRTRLSVDGPLVTNKPAGG